MYAVTVTFKIEPGSIEAFLSMVVENARNSLQREPGCKQFDVCTENGSAEVFLYEIYDDRAAFDDHLASAHFRAFDAAVADMVTAKTVRSYDEVLR